MQMEFAPDRLNPAKLKRMMDIRGMTFSAGGVNHITRGRVYCLWKDGNPISIQAESVARPGVDYTDCMSLPPSHFPDECRDYTYLLEVLHTMADTIEFGTYNWAHMVRQKDGSYRLVYKVKQYVPGINIWTKVVELEDIEITRFGMDVDLGIAWTDEWATWVNNESKGHKVMQSVGLGHYTFELLAHVSKNGIIIGIMTEPVHGRKIVAADRSAVYEAVADLQRHGVLLRGVTKHNIHITDEGVRFSCISSLVYYHDQDTLAKLAERCYWEELAKTFDEEGSLDPGTILFVGSRYYKYTPAFVLPRVPSPNNPLPFGPEQAMIRYVFDIFRSDNYIVDFWKPIFDQARRSRKAHPTNSHHSRRLKDCQKPHIANTDDVISIESPEISRDTALDKPLAPSRLHVSKVRHRPHHKSSPKKLLLGHDDYDDRAAFLPTERPRQVSRSLPSL
ncbi:hypothetical protein BJ138DRAFT_1126155 [Hygrophoropsis aurantiaca]|uniref:Uncharacterized protein n=1 Tax=Hygrophoropsis aurantiaca TaxID=72124 RepID=A0ACB8ADA3_9AGAM|nr:hypothetical protein BJ138DRAFT_1126155 [Hygrophoropsis aurantiaca]